MVIPINMTGVTTKAAALPAGYYSATVAKCEQKRGKSGNQYLSWEFSVIYPEEFVGRKAFFNTSLQQHALWSLKRVLEALGYSEEALSGQIEFDPDDVIGIECTLVTVEDEYNGETVSKVEQILPAGATE
jgi:hypothetical protein